MTMKNRFCDSPRISAFHWHGGVRRRYISVINSPRGRPFGGGDVHPNESMGEEVSDATDPGDGPVMKTMISPEPFF